MSNEYLSFKKNSPEVQKLLEWWDDLDKKHRGERAVLRRCGTLAEVVFSPAYHRLRLSVGRFGTVNDDGLALVVGLAARVEHPVKDHNDENTIAKQMATGNDKAKVSGLRFRRLLKVKEKENLYTSMSRIISILGGTVNLQSLAQSVYFWNDITRKQWAFDYYSKAPGEA